VCGAACVMCAAGAGALCLSGIMQHPSSCSTTHTAWRQTRPLVLPAAPSRRAASACRCLGRRPRARTGRRTRRWRATTSSWASWTCGTWSAASSQVCCVCCERGARACVAHTRAHAVAAWRCRLTTVMRAACTVGQCPSHKLAPRPGEQRRHVHQEDEDAAAHAAAGGEGPDVCQHAYQGPASVWCAGQAAAWGERRQQQQQQAGRARAGACVCQQPARLALNTPCCPLVPCCRRNQTGGDGDFFHTSEAARTTLQDIVVYGLLSPKDRCLQAKLQGSAR
jgi:hypothetical protein